MQVTQLYVQGSKETRGIGLSEKSGQETENLKSPLGIVRTEATEHLGLGRCKAETWMAGAKPQTVNRTLHGVGRGRPWEQPGAAEGGT